MAALASSEGRSSLFQSLILLEAETELVGACCDHESALRIALETLAVDDFRSEQAHELRQVFYVLAGWASQGTYDPDTNRQRLSRYFGGLILDEPWCGHGVLSGYVRGLCEAIVGSNRLLDEAVESRRRWQYENPLRRHDIQKKTPPAPSVGTLDVFRR